MSLLAFAHRMPKAELHVHLEGAIRPATLLRLAEQNGIDIPPKDLAAVQEFYRFRDFSHFVEVYFTITGCLRAAEDYRLIAYEFGAGNARHNVRYAEVTFSVLTNVNSTGLDWRTILDGLNRGRAEARDAFGVDWRWVFDIVRNDPQSQDRVVEIALAAAADETNGVVALGLGGSEAEFPPRLFTQSFERARQAGLARVPHAGETAGPESIWGALRQLHADRIGHGVRAVEDPALIDYLGQRQVPLEVCPTSNVCLGVYPGYSAHPLRQLWDRGLLITVNSDDPPMFGTDLNCEYRILVDHFDFTADELEAVSLNGLRASLLDQAAKDRLETEFRAQFARLREEENV